ncbi:molybdopterin-dependent oxidoreductase [Nocardioides panacisoli]|uniref:Molybdopterin-dependent oxidoreductase n=1 Tax=Nocardioides panacisoli TaxID=627624 RepID=A0ABP7HXE1_9ACTN
MTTATLTCPLCEATCGLRVTLDGDRVTGVRGNPDDVFSHGYICPKGASLGALHEDPDRLRTPMVKRDGRHEPATWDEAFAVIAERLPAVIAEHGADSVAAYLGNPSVHNLSTSLYARVLLKALGTKNVYSASSVDQLPKHFTAGYMFGHPLTIPVPDVDRTDYLLMLGANPLVSNGSLMTAPDIRGRLRGIQQRGGRIVVLDPRRTRTAEAADEHLAIRPGTDALFLFALVQVLFEEGLVTLGALDGLVEGMDRVEAWAKDFAPEGVEARTGIAADDVRRIARELAAADSAAVYGRMGTTTQEFGTLASWLVDVLNVLTGNLDRPGGAMFPLAAAGQANSAPGAGRPFRHDRWQSRVRGLPEVIGELPVAALAEEIRTPGAGQVRALITVCGNPCLSTPNAAALDAALDGLDFMVSVDVYLNETTRHADVILPGPSPLARPHYDIALYQLAVRNVANWSVAALDSDVPQEWRTLLRLAGVVAGQGPDVDITALDDMVAADLAGRAGVDLADVGGRVGPERLIDVLLRGGPYDVTLADLEASPDGVDLGSLAPRLPDVLSTPSGRIELAPEPIVQDVPRLVDSLAAATGDPGGMVLIGRRNLSSNNSWMHNITPLVRGENRCTAQIHPEDATRLGLLDGGTALIRSRTGEVKVPVEVTDVVRPGTVSVPHGWGHDLSGVRMAVAETHAGTNSNVLSDDLLLDAPSGNAVLNGLPVEVAPV